MAEDLTQSLHRMANTARVNGLSYVVTGKLSADGLALIRAAERLAELESRFHCSVTVGHGLRVHGPWEAIKRVQTYILLDSSHPVEREDVRRGLARDLQSAEQLLAGYLRAILAAAGHCQGGHSDAGASIANLLGVPFPLTMPDLIACARANNENPALIWPWLRREPTPFTDAELAAAEVATQEGGDHG